jgi:Protein of unknown function (DUF3604)
MAQCDGSKILTTPTRIFAAAVALALALTGLSITSRAHAQEMQLYWGDTHVHTNYSFDAYLFGNKTADPDTAYRFARGAPVLHPATRVRIQLDRPLDFLTVADHAEALGVIRRLDARDKRILETRFAKENKAAFASNNGLEIFRRLAQGLSKGENHDLYSELQTPEILAPAWNDVITAADRNNRPGEFTALIGWEWSSAPGNANLHRVVVSDANASTASSFLPFSAIDSQDPEALWRFLSDTASEFGVNFVSIPHNSNLSRGLAFAIEDVNGQPITADYARRRMMWERVVEVTQTKGDSETHPVLSPTDEFANFEFYPFLVSGGQYRDGEEISGGSYARSALKRGLAIQGETGENPFQFGMIGSTDVHTGLSTTDEREFAGKLPMMATPEARLDRKKNLGDDRVNTWDMGAQGLAAVWAEENTRQSIINAFRRREVYATTGSRIMLRVFAGASLSPRIIKSRNWVKKARSKGVPMGGELFGGDTEKSPTFLIQAVKDPRSASLDRVQVIKGWLDSSGKMHEQVFNVALSGDRIIADDGSAPALLDTVNRENASYDAASGNTEFLVAWTDPVFRADEPAFYYVRVLEAPTPRHSLYDQVALQETIPGNVTLTLQERAYSSPIWYTPAQ